MKKFITLFLIMIFSFNPLAITSSVAVATSNYLRVIDEETIFYSNANETSALFYLPYTYYVKHIGEAGGFIHIECYGTQGNPALDGYVKADKLFDDGLIVNNPFVNLTITTATTSVLYTDSALTSPIQYVFAERNLRYYGSFFTADKNAYYVEYNGKLGYIKEEDVYPFVIPNHPNELTFLPEEEPDLPTSGTVDQPTSAPEDLLNLKIIIIVCLLFAGIVALFLALKHKPSQRVATGYYDENDYE